MVIQTRTVILGPPGTGKTTALMAIVRDLLAEGFASNEIAFVSYSRASVAEAKARVVALTGIPAERWPAFRTLHSTWARALGLGRDAYLTSADLRLFAERDGGYDLDARDESTDDAYLDADAEPGRDAPLRGALDWCRASMRPLRDGIDRLRDPARDRDRYLAFCFAYDAFRHDVGKLDHTDILEDACTARLAIPCRALIVDEAQDLSPLQQATLAPTLATVERAWVAGDDDQAIYEFQGASPRWLIDLTRDPAWTTQILDRSWRCPEEVRAPAARVAARLSERARKDYRSRAGAGVYHVGAEWAALLPTLRPATRSAFALARTKKGCARMRASLHAAGVAYVAERGGRSPLDPRGLRGLVDVLTAIYTDSPVKASAAAAVLTSPVCPGERGKARTGIVGRGGKTAIEAWAVRHGDAEVQLDRDAATALGLDRAYSTEPWTLLASVSAWPTAAGDAAGDLAWLRSLWDRHRGAWPAHPVTVTTWHGAKGREADIVIIDPALPWPAARALSAGGATADTEHRCAYVALTRARHTAIVLVDDYEAKANYRFPSPCAERRYPPPATEWAAFASPDWTAIDALRETIATRLPDAAAAGVVDSILWAWMGWRDQLETLAPTLREAAALREAASRLPAPVASRLVEALA